jgi:lysyl endopeptidase
MLYIVTKPVIKINMRNIYSAIAVIFGSVICSFSAIGQINYGGTPSFNINQEALSTTRVVMPDISRDILAQEDAITDQIKEVPWRFGVENEVNFSPINSGYWNIEGDENVWRIEISCADATSVSVRFAEFGLEKGAYLFIWSKDSQAYIGKFDHRSRKDWGGLATGVVEGSEIIVELHQPLDMGTTAPILIDQVVYGYRSLLLHPESQATIARGPFGNSGDCNINVNCPEGALWATEKRSVALIVEGGFAACTGALINNTLNDGTPYFLTANHCLGNPGNWVYYFNHESATCNGNTGPTGQSVSGGTTVVSNGGSDYAILELSEIPPASFNVQYAGWDASGDTPLNATGIHHPSGDVKKICFEEDSPYFDSAAGAAVWMIDQWELGVTEGGSSGSPLFDNNHRIIGQLYGGAAACAGNVNNGQFDYYGRLNESFTLGASDYLDPTGSGVMVWDGFPDGAVSYANDAGISIDGAPDGLLCGSESVSLEMVLMNTGTEDLTSATLVYNVNGTSAQQINWTGSLSQYESEAVSIPSFEAIGGENSVTAEVSNPNGVADENSLNNDTEVTFTTFSGETFDFTLAITLDDYGSETSWEIKKLGTVLYSGGPYSNGTDGEIVLVDLCLEEGCYLFIIEDSWGDGICCEYGEGHWEILNENSVIIANSNGEFGDSETEQFCTDDEPSEMGDIPSNIESLVYPNPANKSLTIEFPLMEGQILITDIEGRIMMNANLVGETSQTLDVSSWSEGMYLVTLKGANSKMMTRRITITH